MNQKTFVLSGFAAVKLNWPVDFSARIWDEAFQSRCGDIGHPVTPGWRTKANRFFHGFLSDHQPSGIPVTHPANLSSIPLQQLRNPPLSSNLTFQRCHGVLGLRLFSRNSHAKNTPLWNGASGLTHREISCVNTLQRGSEHLPLHPLTMNAPRNTKVAGCVNRLHPTPAFTPL
jgi:hypothetical protein